MPRDEVPLEKCIGHSLKMLGPSQKIFATWCPKLVTGLGTPIYFVRLTRWNDNLAKYQKTSALFARTVELV